MIGIPATGPFRITLPSSSWNAWTIRQLTFGTSSVSLGPIPCIDGAREAHSLIFPSTYVMVSASALRADDTEARMFCVSSLDRHGSIQRGYPDHPRLGI